MLSSLAYYQWTKNQLSKLSNTECLLSSMAITEWTQKSSDKNSWHIVSVLITSQSQNGPGKIGKTDNTEFLL